MSLRYIIIALASIAIIYGAFWHGLADRAESSLKEQVEALNDSGAHIELGDVSTSGFPYRFEIAIPSIFAQNDVGPVPWSVSSAMSYIFTHPWTPGHYVATSQGLEIELGELQLRAPESRASLLLGREKSRVDADLGSVQFQFPKAGSNTLNAARLQLHLMVPHNEGEASDEADVLRGPERADVALSLDRLGLGPFQAGAPAPSIEHLELRSELHGALAVPLTTESLGRWRDEGGTVELRQVEMQWGAVQITGEGSFALDEELRPLGALTLDVREPGLLVRYLESQGLIDRDAAPLIREGVDEIAALGGRDSMRLPMTIQDGTVFLGPIAIAKIAPLIDE